MDMRVTNSGRMAGGVIRYSNQGSPARYSGSCRFSIDPPLLDRRQEPVVEDVACGRAFAEFEILRDLIDSVLKAGPVDAAEAVAPDLVGQDVVGEHGAQAFELRVAVGIIHAAGGLARRARRLLHGGADAGDQRAEETLHRVGL